MSFTVEDEDTFHASRDELLDDYARWLASSNAEGDAGDAGVVLDWKWGYQDGELGRWTVADLEEFMLDWCPRKLSLPAEDCADFPRSIRAFMTFLAARGLLAPGSGTLSHLQRCCESSTARFVTKMADPANYGLAKGLFAGAGGLDPGLVEADVAALMQRINSIDELPTLTVGPAQLPEPAERAESAAAAPVLSQLQLLWEFCAAPGRPLTQKGNLRLADARHLVDALGTGDVPDLEIGDYQRTLRSADDLPVLSWLVELAIGARVLRRHRGRLVAVARWRQLSPVEALDRLVDTAVEAGLSGALSPYLYWMETVQDVVDGGVGRLLAELIDWQAAGKPVPIDELAELMVMAVVRSLSGLDDVHVDVVHGWIRDQLDRLAALGVVTLHGVQGVPTGWRGTQARGGVAELTPAGVPVAVRLAEELGIIVLSRPDPATATARDLITLIEHLQPETWLADTAAWVAHRGAGPAARQIVTVLNDAETPAPVVLAVLTQLDGLVGEHAIPAVKTMLDGPHDSFAVQSLLLAGALDPTEVDRDRLVRAGIDFMAVRYDVGGPDDLFAMLVSGDGGTDEQSAVLDNLWRTEHPRLAELLQVIGEHHPDKRVAKSARKTLLQHRSFVASHPSAVPDDSSGPVVTDSGQPVIG
ncbi:MAG TPA: hypothetical protein VIY28_05820 [Pseudonocardiaceae bacterium]